MREICVKTKQGDYKVTIEPGCLDRLGLIAAQAMGRTVPSDAAASAEVGSATGSPAGGLAAGGQTSGSSTAEGPAAGLSVMVVSDDIVGPLYLGRAIAALKAAGFKTYSYMHVHGEDQKNLHTLERIYRVLHTVGISRSDLIVALGGGVIGDITGFAAATYQRGVPYIQVPTSLLAQVDASVGGKTAVDMPFGKNMVGAFYQPKAVVIDTETLKTLPPIRLSEGMAEVIKYGCISDPAIFDHASELADRGDLPDEELIARCVAIKADIVGQDELDKGLRMILNFGHTLGHAVEKATGFSMYTHGAAVAAGMVAAVRVGERLGVTPAGIEQKLREVLEKWDLPVSAAISAEEALAAVSADKKWLSGTLNFILLKELGQAVIHPVDMELLAPVVKEVWLEAGVNG